MNRAISGTTTTKENAPAKTEASTTTRSNSNTELPIYEAADNEPDLSMLLAEAAKEAELNDKEQGGLYKSKTGDKELENLINTLNQQEIERAKERAALRKKVADEAVSKALAPIRESKLPLDAGRVNILSEPPPPRDYVRFGMISGVPYVWAGFGGAGKSMLSLQMAIEICLGKTLTGEGITQGAVIVVFGEDDTPESTRRASAVVKHFGLERHIPTIQKNLRVFGMVGKDMRLTAPNGGTLAAMRFMEDIINAAHELREESGLPVRLIVLDHLGLLHGGDFNAREDASVTMRVLNHIAQETKAAVLALAHSPKSSAASEESTAQAVAGSSTFVDMARGAFILAPMREAEAKALDINKESRKDFVSCTAVKNNYGPIGVPSWFQKSLVVGYGMSVLAPVTLKPHVKTQAPSKNLEAKIIELVSEYRGGLSRTKVRDSYSGKEGRLGASKSEVVQCLDLMIANGKLVTRAPSQEERKTHDLSQQITQVLDTTGD